MTDKQSAFQLGVEAMRKAAIQACLDEIRHANSHKGDPRYENRAAAAHACAIEIQFLEVKE